MLTSGYLPAWVLQVAGIAIIFGSLAFWAVSGQQSALFVGAGVTLTGLGAYRGVHQALERGEESGK